MRNLKMMAFAVLFGAISFLGYVSSIGSSHDMKISGIETSDMLIESRNVRPLRQLLPLEQQVRENSHFFIQNLWILNKKVRVFHDLLI
jgi:hypothetical protein